MEETNALYIFGIVLYVYICMILRGVFSLFDGRVPMVTDLVKGCLLYSCLEESRNMGLVRNKG